MFCVACYFYLYTRYAAGCCLSLGHRDIENCPNIAHIFINVNEFIQSKTAYKHRALYCNKAEIHEPLTWSLQVNEQAPPDHQWVPHHGFLTLQMALFFLLLLQ